MTEATPNATSTSTSTSPSSSSPHSTPSPPPGLPTTFTFPTNLPQPPFINISGVPNFRDLGGYLTATSYLSAANPLNTKPHMVRKNLIYRCAHPQLLTSEGTKQLTQTHNIKHIYDLRSAPEVKKLSASLPATSSTDATTNPHSSALQPEGITRHFTPVYADEDYSPATLAKKVGWYTASQSKTSRLPYAYSEGFVSAYRDIALYGTIAQPGQSCPSHNAAAYPTILRQLLSHPDEPIVFHCTAGKDRTGVLAALLLRLAGVDDECIAWEYALTEPGLGSWRDLFIERISRTGMGGASQEEKEEEEGQGEGEQQKSTADDENGNDADKHPSTSSTEMRKLYPQGMPRSEAARIVGARSGNMRAFLTLVLDGEFGGVEKYMVEKCGLSKDEVEELRRILVVEVEKVEDVVPWMGVRIQGWSAEGGVVDDEGEDQEGERERL